MEIKEPSQEEIDLKYNEILRHAKRGGYFLNPDEQFAKDLVKGLIINDERYGFEACPCRLVLGEKELNLDIVCPCYYRDDDITEYGCCYCGLYVNEDISNGEKPVTAIPERRDLKSRGKDTGAPVAASSAGNLPYPVYRCNVCGYLCARNKPPEKCPVCGADQKRFDLFMR
ncbi:putative ferredoxin-thioredoxin reductase,catalyticsubunit [Methanolacinia petrolearia DSM 11571]|uniref:ferredoxin:thioredoxin reductase n=1 Tax=Methanolacinia petrolearia (strain DSM 11571 / OCM 486 / SEBR 4847) TaxID=679926 RepID=E1RET1_METP4|nr:ferredoxin-thioredoxin reductase catalytic domain-containing protein [Methanolacinia petrolearia]ADN36102.1 putative ferredoxin-thioredoxin reductase,catalyticsubunit [Methanolacinia petrolearia DSM 11571]